MGYIFQPYGFWRRALDAMSCAIFFLCVLNHIPAGARYTPVIVVSSTGSVTRYEIVNLAGWSISVLLEYALATLAATWRGTRTQRRLEAGSHVQPNG